MKNFFVAILAAMLMTPAMAQAQNKQGKTLEVSFDYQKQAGPGSNQYAVWIENEKGDVVKTLFVTSYTTKGRVRGNEQPMRGYVKRPNCVPTWVKASKPARSPTKNLMLLLEQHHRQEVSRHSHGILQTSKVRK